MAHYYEQTETGVEPRHFVPMAKDPSRSRGTRITDVKKWLKEGKKVYPSVTTILQMLDKPALNNWKVDQHLQTVYAQIDMMPQIADIGLDAWVAKIKSITQERLDAAPKAGTDIHKVLEDFFVEGKMPEPLVEKTICKNVLNKFADIGLVDIQCEKYFADTNGYAGCSDIVAVDKDGNGWIIDYKSKQTSEAFQKGKGKLYAEHYRQLGAYGNAIHGVMFRAAIIYVDLESGDIDFVEAGEKDLHNGYMDFLDCLNIWIRNNLN